MWGKPFRYRSYYYDPETRLYFLKTRYYDPEIGRFISPDSIDYADPMSLDGLNLYAYCNNNPVMNVDPTGQSFLVFVLVGLIAGAVIGGTVKGIEAHNDGATGWDLAGEIALGASIGAIIGAVAGAVVGAGAAVIGAGMTAIGGGAAAIAGGGTQIVGGAVAAITALGLSIVFSKHNPGMSNKPPVSWTDIDEGLEVYKKFGGNSNKAAEYLLDKFRGVGNWNKGARTEFNALKKWFDRVIRLWKK